jgi:hypothetical protein
MLPMLDDMGPPPSPESQDGTAAVEATAPPVATMVEDEVGRLRAQLEAMQEAIARLEREAATGRASHAEAQA